MLTERFKIILLALHVYEYWFRCVVKIQDEQEYYKSTNYSYIVCNLMRISTVCTEGGDFSVSMQRSSRYKSSETCHTDVGQVDVNDTKCIVAYEALRVTCFRSAPHCRTIEYLTLGSGNRMPKNIRFG